MIDEPPSPPPAADEPKKSFLDKIGAALPIALTAIATAFAGMSTGELQKAMLWRSLAAQDQAKATNQWTYAGFKRDRALICQATAALLRVAPGSAAADFAKDGGDGAAWLAGGGPPRVKLPDVPDATLAELLDAIRTRRPEAEVLVQARKVTAKGINEAIDAAEKFAEQTDKEWTPAVEQARAAVAKAGTPGAQAAGFELDRRRYEAESRLNQGIGYLYEARVKVSSAESDKHEHKSKNFFYAMLAAQIGATISALALARKQQSLLWLVAGAAGAVAILIGAAVFLADL